MKCLLDNPLSKDASKKNHNVENRRSENGKFTELILCIWFSGVGHRG